MAASHSTGSPGSKASYYLLLYSEQAASFVLYKWSFFGSWLKGIKDSDVVTKKHLAPGVRGCLVERAEPGSETSAQGDKDTCAAGQGPAT